MHALYLLTPQPTSFFTGISRLHAQPRAGHFPSPTSQHRRRGPSRAPDPARSTRLSLPAVMAPSPSLRACSTTSVKTECERDESAFIAVAPT
eukprot:1383414-Pleurochrysis_carterae.AAC.1